MIPQMLPILTAMACSPALRYFVAGVAGDERGIGGTEVRTVLLSLPSILWTGQNQKEQGHLSRGRADEHGHRRPIANRSTSKPADRAPSVRTVRKTELHPTNTHFPKSTFSCFFLGYGLSE